MGCSCGSTCTCTGGAQTCSCGDKCNCEGCGVCDIPHDISGAEANSACLILEVNRFFTTPNSQYYNTLLSRWTMDMVTIWWNQWTFLSIKYKWNQYFEKQIASLESNGYFSVIFSVACRPYRFPLNTASEAVSAPVILKHTNGDNAYMIYGYSQRNVFFSPINSSLHTVNIFAIAIFSVSDACANSANPEITNAGRPAGINIILNQRIGSSPRSWVLLASP